MIREFLLRKVLAAMASRPYDFAIGPEGDRYMLRWYVTPWSRYERGSKPKNFLDAIRRKLPSIYLHRFLHDDEDRALHDHPWPSCSIVLSNGYWEVLDSEQNGRGPKGKTFKVFRPEGAIHFRSASTAHRVELLKKAGRLGRSEPVEAITIFLTGPVVRNWGFLCPKGWRPWQEFVSARDAGSVGRGCE